MVSNQERRLVTRKPAQFFVRFYYSDTLSDVNIAHTSDLSTQGACIESPNLLPVGASVKFFVFTPQNQVIDVVGQVIHVNQIDSLPFRLGVRFTKLANAQRQLLARELSIHTA